MVFKITSIFLFSWFLIHIVIITIDGLTDQNKTVDVAVVLGNKVNEDATLSRRLEARLACALKLFQTRGVKKLIISGGLGKEGYYEGDKMREYLILNHVPDSCIIVDNQGDNTLATVKNSIIII